MIQGRISKEDSTQMIDELATALQKMVNTSCQDMLPLWLAGTRLARKHLTDTVRTLPFTPSEKYLNFSRGRKSQYTAVACWRLAVIWKGILPKVDRDFAQATKAIYFTPYPKNEPPYAWSSKPSDAPDVTSFASPATLKNQSKEGVWQLIEVLHSVYHDTCSQSYKGEIERLFLEQGMRKSLRERFHLKEFGEWPTL